MSVHRVSAEIDLKEAFHLAAVAFLAWRVSNDQKAVMSYVAYHRHAFMPLSYPVLREGGHCAYKGVPMVWYGGREYSIITICRYMRMLPGPLPPVLRALF